MLCQHKTFNTILILTWFFFSFFFSILWLFAAPTATSPWKLHMDFPFQGVGFMHGWVDGWHKRAKGLFWYLESKFWLFLSFHLSVIHFLSFCSLFIFVPFHCFFFFFPLSYISFEGTSRASIFIRARRQPSASARQPKPPGCSHPWQRLNLPTVHWGGR